MNKIEFGVTIIKEYSESARPKIKYYDYLSVSDATINFGETFLSIIEKKPCKLIEMLSVPEYFYNISREASAITKIREFSKICINEQRTNKIAVMSLIEKLSQTKFTRRLYSNYGVANLPYADNLYELVKFLNKQNITFSVTIAYQVNSFKDICLVSLLIISELRKTLRKCYECGGFFIAAQQEYYCDRKNENNEHLGCKLLRKKRQFAKHQEMTSSKLYIRIYNRLSSRAKRNDNYYNIRKNFVDGWKKTSDNFSHLSNEEIEKKRLIYLEEWEKK